MSNHSVENCRKKNSNDRSKQNNSNKNNPFKVPSPPKNDNKDVKTYNESKNSNDQSNKPTNPSKWNSNQSQKGAIPKRSINTITTTADQPTMQTILEQEAGTSKPKN